MVVKVILVIIIIVIIKIVVNYLGRVYYLVKNNFKRLIFLK